MSGASTLLGLAANSILTIVFESGLKRLSILQLWERYQFFYCFFYVFVCADTYVVDFSQCDFKLTKNVIVQNKACLVLLILP